MGWQERYLTKQRTPDEAVALLTPGMSIFLGTACGEPQTIVRRMVEARDHIDDAEISQLLSLGLAPYTEQQYSGRFRHNSYFIGPPARAAVREGRADYTPIALSDIPRLLHRGLVKLDAALICVSPPDEHGYVSLGVSVDVVRTAVDVARLVVAEVNPSMPRTLGHGMLHVDQIDWFVPAETDILEFDFPEPSETQLQVARNVAQLVEDGATLETGIGVIPTTVLRYLGDRRDLGVHTEVMGDAVVELVEAGVITNRRKTLHRGETVTSFCMGTRRLYDHVDNNPGVSFRATEYVNDPAVIARNRNMAAINVALEVDITGQVAADSIGPVFYSGIGGQVDFIRGAGKSEGGRPIICLPSRTRDGKGRIVSTLTPGAGVVTPRSDVHFVVTEYGFAYLHGRSIRERVIALIQIAHPDDRDGLLAYARQHGWVDAAVAVAPLPGHPYPGELERTAMLKDGTAVFLRPLRASDEDPVKAFFYALEDQSLYSRFFRPQVHLAAERRAALKDLDYDHHMAIGGFLGEPGREELVGVANYIRDATTDLADIAFIVRDDWQGQGLGTHLSRTLTEIAIARGLSGFRADVLAYNRPVLRILQSSGYVVRTRVEEGTYSVTLRFAETAPETPIS